MKILEKFLAAVILLALVLKFGLVKDADTILMLGLLVLSGIYFYSGFLLFNQIRLRHVFKKEAYANVTSGGIAMGIIAGVAFSIICVGILFKLLMLTGANEMLLSGTAFTFVILITSLVSLLRKGDGNSKLIFIRAAIFVVIGVVLFRTSTLTIVKIQYRDHPAYVEAYAEYQKDIGNVPARQRMELEYQRILLSSEEFKEYEKEAARESPDMRSGE